AQRHDLLLKLLHRRVEDLNLRVRLVAFVGEVEDQLFDLIDVPVDLNSRVAPEVEFESGLGRRGALTQGKHFTAVRHIPILTRDVPSCSVTHRHDGTYVSSPCYDAGEPFRR